MHGFWYLLNLAEPYIFRKSRPSQALHKAWHMVGGSKLPGRYILGFGRFLELYQQSNKSSSGSRRSSHENNRLNYYRNSESATTLHHLFFTLHQPHTYYVTPNPNLYNCSYKSRVRKSRYRVDFFARVLLRSRIPRSYIARVTSHRVALTCFCSLSLNCQCDAYSMSLRTRWCSE